MTPEDQANQKDLERKRLLEEIRRRAEEAELKRIEEEEQKAGARPLKATPTTPGSPSKPTLELRINELRDKLNIALDRGKSDKAVELYEELRAAAPDNSELDDYKIRIDRLREDLQQQQKAKKRAADLKSKEEAAQQRAKRESQQRKIAELMESANSLYQQEKYDRGMAALREILALDEENEDARKLGEKIEKAKQLFEQIRAEEARRKEEESAGAPPPVPEAPMGPRTEAEVWGNRDQPGPETGIEVPEDDGPPGPPSQPRIERVVERLSSVRVPVKPVLLTIGIAVLVVVAYLIVDDIQNAVFPAKYSLLILPARAPEADTSLAYIADAMTEELISNVSVITELRVFGPVTSFALSRSGASSVQVAKSIGANYVVQWDIARNGEDFIFSLGLLDTLSSSPVWSTNGKTSSRELQSVLLELGKGVAGAVQVPVTPQEEKYFAAAPEVSPAAFEAYARGISRLRRSGSRLLEEASQSFSRAIHLDPAFTRAHAALSWTHLMMYEQESEGSGALLASVQASLRDAVAVGTPTSEMFRGRALAAQFRSDYDRALEELERAIAVAPSDAEAHRRLSLLYAIRGRGDEAVKSATRATSDDPRNVASYTVLAMALQYRAMVYQLNGRDQEMRHDLRSALGSYEAGLILAPDRSEYMGGLYSDLLHATQQTERAIQILSDRVAQFRQDYVEYYKLGRLYQAAGRPKSQWESIFERARTLLIDHLGRQPDDALALSYLALVHTRLGQFREAVDATGRAQAISPANPDVLYNIARVFVLHREKDRALQSLKSAVDLRYKLATLLDMDFYTLRTDPDFYSIITR
jgi:tetratricopeptide (TPR) repeat protein